MENIRDSSSPTKLSEDDVSTGRRIPTRFMVSRRTVADIMISFSLNYPHSFLSTNDPVRVLKSTPRMEPFVAISHSLNGCFWRELRPAVKHGNGSFTLPHTISLCDSLPNPSSHYNIIYRKLWLNIQLPSRRRASRTIEKEKDVPDPVG